MVYEGEPKIIDIEEFQYNYKCKHCEHEWSEKHTENTEKTETTRWIFSQNITFR